MHDKEVERSYKRLSRQLEENMARCTKFGRTRCKRQAVPGKKRCQQCLDNNARSRKKRDDKRMAARPTCTKCYKPVCHPNSFVCEDHRLPIAGHEKDSVEADAIFWNSWLLIAYGDIEEDIMYWRPWERAYIRGLET